MPNRSLPLLPLVLDDVPRGLRRALAQEGVPFCDRRDGAPQGRFVLFDSRGGRCRAPAPGQTLVDVDALRGDSLDDPLAALVDERSARFRWEIDGWNVSEEIARVDKRAVRRLVLDRLRERIERAGGVWLRLAAFPFPYRSAFNFRLDHDEYIPEDFDATMDALAGWEHATTYYVNAAAYQRAAGAWERLGGLDVGSHAYWRHTYRTEEENLRNIRRGIETIRAAGIEPHGFAAPGGRFHAALAAAMTKLDIDHSSEFGLAYDELPFEPINGGPLQLPIHPVCLGMFLEAARCYADDSPARVDWRRREAARAASDYLCRLAESRYHQGEPVFFYGHPSCRLGCHVDVLRGVLQTIGRLAAIWKTTHRQFAAWWRARSAVQLVVTRQGGQFMVAADAMPSGWRLAVEFWHGKHVASMPLEESVLYFSPEALAYENRNQRTTVHPVRIDGPQGIRTHLGRLIDWERVTPVEEIVGGGWRNAAKRTLRRWW